MTDWGTDTAKRIGKAVQFERNRKKWTAARLSDETAALGFSIHRVAIGKLENGHRGAKFDVTELAVLARALGVPPVQLLYPDLIDGPVEALPGVVAESGKALRWFTGEDASSWNLPRLFEEERSPFDIAPLELVRIYYGSLEQFVQYDDQLANVQSDSATAKSITERVISLRETFNAAREQLRALGFVVNEAGASDD